MLNTNLLQIKYLYKFFLGIKTKVVGQLYKKTAAFAERFIRANINEWKIGGAGRIVLVDTYPDVCANSNHVRGRRIILCLSEVQVHFVCFILIFGST